MGVVLFNHLGSSKTGDSGGDAANVAAQLGMHVIAADRPGSGWSMPVHGMRLAAGYVGAMSQLARRHIAPEIERMGLKAVVLFGRSAGGYGALAAGQTELLPAAAVHVQDPIGWRTVTVREGRAIFNGYQLHQQQRLAEDPSLVHPEPSDKTGAAKYVRRVQNTVFGAVDVLNNQHVWRQSLACVGALAIASNMPGTRLDILFAEDTYVIDPREPAFLQEELATARMLHGDDDAQPVRVEVVPDTVHASFDLRHFSASLLEETVTATLTPPHS